MSFYQTGGLSPEDLLHFEDFCSHKWEYCVHQNVGALGPVVQCKTVSKYSRYTHYLCSKCGKERFPNRWLDIVEKEIIPRLLASQKIQIRHWDNAGIKTARFIFRL